MSTTDETGIIIMNFDGSEEPWERVGQTEDGRPICRTATGVSKAELIRRAVEAYLIASGYLQPLRPNPSIPNKENA